MCSGQPDSAANVTTNATPGQDAAQRKKLKDEKIPGTNEPKNPQFQEPDPKVDTANKFQELQATNQGFDIAPPPDSPDLTDEMLRKRRASAATQAMLGRGRSSTMRPTDYADLNATARNKLYGG